MIELQVLKLHSLYVMFMDKSKTTNGLSDSLKVISNWLLNYVPEYLDVEVLLDEFCHNLVKYKIPLWRASLNIHTSHSDIFVRNIIWTENQGCRSELVHQIDLNSEIFLKSPVAKIYSGSGPIRRQLVGPNAKLDFPVCKEIAQSGGTDYFIAPLKFTNGTVSYISFTTKQGEGFSDQHIHFLEDIIPYLNLRIEVESSYFSCKSMLSRFVGRHASIKIESGDVKAGDVEECEAVLIYWQIQELKKINGGQSLNELITSINKYYEIIYREVMGRGGEIASSNHEGMIAIFEIGLVSKQAAIRNTLNSLKDILSRVYSQDNNQLGLKVFVNLGPIIQANIGCSDRLNFSLLGPLLAKTIEASCKLSEYSEDVFVSSSFKEESKLDLDSQEVNSFFPIHDCKAIKME